MFGSCTQYPWCSLLLMLVLGLSPITLGCGDDGTQLMDADQEAGEDSGEEDSGEGDSGSDDGGEQDTGEADAGAEDSGGPDVGEDSGEEDSGEPDGGDTGTDAAEDTGPPVVCGDGVVEGSELCDGDSVACTDLGQLYRGTDTATCRADCSGYEVSSCLQRAGRLWEMVKPADRDGRWQDARCNDGTAFDFVYRPGAADSKLWVIYLQGGGFGDDEAFAVAEREENLRSTTPVLDRARGPIAATDVGILKNGATNPDFRDAHHIFAHYCSSDLWTGVSDRRRPVEGDDEGYFFSGRLNVRAMYEILAQRFGLDDRDAETRVVHAGASAGCVGAMQTADEAARVLPLTASGDRLRVLADSAYLVEYTIDGATPGWGATEMSDSALLTRAIDFWGAEPSSYCTAATQGSCYGGAVAYQALSSNAIQTFVAQSPNDVVIMGLRKNYCTEGCGGSCTPGCTALSDAQYESIRQQHVDDYDTAGVEWLFSWGSTQHVISAGNTWQNLPGADEQLRTVFGDFFFDRTEPRRVFVNGADEGVE